MRWSSPVQACMTQSEDKPYGGTSPPTAHSGSRGHEVINCPLPSVCDKVCSRGCEILWLHDFLRQLPHFLHNLTRTIRGEGGETTDLRRQHGTALSLFNLFRFDLSVSCHTHPKLCSPVHVPQMFRLRNSSLPGCFKNNREDSAR